jgi:hypothetical protein
MIAFSQGEGAKCQELKHPISSFTLDQSPAHTFGCREARSQEHIQHLRTRQEPVEGDHAAGFYEAKMFIDKKAASECWLLLVSHHF